MILSTEALPNSTPLHSPCLMAVYLVVVAAAYYYTTTPVIHAPDFSLEYFIIITVFPHAFVSTYFRFLFFSYLVF